MSADPPRGQTGSKGVAYGAVGRDPVTEEAPTKQVAQLYQLLEPLLLESRSQGQPKPGPGSKVFSGTSDKGAPNEGNLEKQGGFATRPSSASMPYLPRILLPSMLPTTLHRQQELVVQGVEDTLQGVVE